MNRNKKTKLIVKKTGVFETICDAVSELVDVVKDTYGPASNKCLIDKAIYSMTVDDGVQIARDFESNDSVRNAVVKVVKKVAIATNDRSKDGTTGALLVLFGIVSALKEKSGFVGRSVEKELKIGLKEVEEQLKAMAVPIETKEDLKKVARIAFDNEEVTEMVADLYSKLGKNATITLENSPNMEITAEMSDGVALKSGYISPYMVTNPDKMEAEFHKPYILLTDYRITQNEDILPILNLMAKEQKQNLVVIAENVEQKALSTMVINLPQVNTPNQSPDAYKVSSLAIALPKVSDRKQFMEDLALLTGATTISESKGNKMENVTLEHLGRAKKIISRQKETIIVEPQGDKADIATAITQLRANMENETDSNKKDKLEQRLGLFTNSLAVIKVGAVTDEERTTLRYKIEDAVNSVKLAYNHGVVCGSGLALSQIKTSSDILNEALKYPSRQLYKNIGYLDIDSYELGKDEAVNVVTEKRGNFMDVGVVDPVNTLLSGVESAVSIASLLVTMSSIIVEAPIDDK